GAKLFNNIFADQSGVIGGAAGNNLNALDAFDLIVGEMDAVIKIAVVLVCEIHRLAWMGEIFPQRLAQNKRLLVDLFLQEVLESALVDDIGTRLDVHRLAI